jgi:hypothetical protein
MENKLFSFLIVCVFSLLGQVHANWGWDCRGKVDVGPAFVRIDVLESKKTVERIDMVAIRGDANILLLGDCGFALKPSIIYGRGKHHSELLSGALGVGYCFPVAEGVTVTPSVGCTFTDLSTHIDLPAILLTDIKETFRSVAPYVALEVSYRILPGWRVSGMVQYAWSRTHTKLKGLLSDHSHSQGPNLAAMIEHDINDHWSINLGGAYNISLTKEKHGLRAVGAKLGVVYWF